MVFAAIWMVAALVCVGLAIDLGNLYFTQRALQRTANMAAMDAAWVASGCLAPVDNRALAARNEAQASVVRNGGDAAWVQSPQAVMLGQRRTLEGRHQFVGTSPALASAVRVELLRPLPTRIVPMFSAPVEGQMRAAAAAEALPKATVNVGSFLASASPPVVNRTLCELIGCAGAGLNIDALSYRDLFAAEIRLSELVPGQPDTETIAEFLDTEISFDGLLGLIADALIEAGDTATAATVQAIADASDAAETVLPSAVFDVVEGFEEPLRDAVIGVGSLVAGAAESLRGGNALTVAIDELGLLPALGPGTLTVRLPGRETTLVGPAGFDETGRPFTEAANSRMFVQLDLELGRIEGQPVRLSVFADVAGADARVEQIECARRGRDQTRVLVAARSGISRIGIGSWRRIGDENPVDEPVSVLELELLGQPLRISAHAVANVGQAGREQLVFTRFGREHAQRIGTGSGEALDAAIASLAETLEFDVTGIPDGVLGEAVGVELAPVLDALRTLVLDSLGDVDGALGQTLGSTLGGADVWIAGEPEVSSAYLFLR